jgi:hypothetical protein
MELRDRVREATQEALALPRPVIARRDLSGWERTFTTRANDGIAETFGARLLAAATNNSKSVARSRPASGAQGFAKYFHRDRSRPEKGDGNVA